MNVGGNTGARLIHFNPVEALVEIKKVVADFKYKPGWTFDVTSGDDEYLFHINTQWLQLGTDKPLWDKDASLATVLGPMVTVGHLMFADNIEAATLNGLRLCIRISELHEMDEWCEYRGERRWNPHHRNVF